MVLVRSVQLPSDWAAGMLAHVPGNANSHLEHVMFTYSDTGRPVAA
jgi:hypothetical protein